MVISSVTDKEPVPELREQCKHHWIIDAAEGRTSFGRCKYCGLVKVFSNSIQNPFINGEYGKLPKDSQELESV